MEAGRAGACGGGWEGCAARNLKGKLKWEGKEERGLLGKNARQVVYGSGISFKSPCFHSAVGLHQGGRVSRGLFDIWTLLPHDTKWNALFVFLCLPERREWLAGFQQVEPIAVIHDMVQSFVAILVPCECIMAYNGQKHWDRLGNVFTW